MYLNIMNIVLLGPQGSGKGTQARLLCQKYGFYYFESGAYLRRIAKQNSDLEKTLAEGKLVPGKEMTSYLTAFLDSQQIYDNILFDGFPRTLKQYRFLKSWLSDREVSIDLVFNLKISEKESVRRLSARRMDPATGEIYNLITDVPPKSVDKSKLVQREDDKPKAIKQRLLVYRKFTLPLISEFKKDTKVVDVDGQRPIETIFKQLVSIIDKENEH